MKVLVVDDAMFMRKMIRSMLEKDGHTVVAEASNGKEAVSLYEKHRPDLVTMDITMPEMDGLTALKHIKEIDSKAVVIMCSAMGQQSVVLEGIKNGAQDFLVKPFNEQRVLESIRKLMR